MDCTASRKPSWATGRTSRYAILTGVVAAAISYAGLEIAVRSLGLPDAELIDSIETRIAELPNLDRDPEWSHAEYGWGADGDLRWQSSVPADGPAGDRAEQRILFMGDSVTRGFGVEVESEAFVARIARRLQGSAGTVVVNAAVQGFGVDQMVWKLRESVARYRPTLIVLAYIPHDLWRVARDVNYGLPKPVLVETETTFAYAPEAKEGLISYYRRYERARRYGFRSIWTLGHVAHNRRYYFPWAYAAYYRSVFGALYDELRGLAARAGAALVVVRLPSAWPGAPVPFLDALARPIFDTDGRDPSYEFYDSEPCVRSAAHEAGIDFDAAFRWHPGAYEHALIESCLLPVLRGSARVSKSTLQGSEAR